MGGIQPLIADLFQHGIALFLGISGKAYAINVDILYKSFRFARQ